MYARRRRRSLQSSTLVLMIIVLSVVALAVPMLLHIYILNSNDLNLQLQSAQKNDVAVQKDTSHGIAASEYGSRKEEAKTNQEAAEPSMPSIQAQDDWQQQNDSIEKQCAALPECKKDWQYWTDPCTFYERGTGPIPVVLMALGRSGSSITWSTLSALTGERNIAYERTGQTENVTEQFFKCLENCPLAFHNWTIQSLCHIQQRRSDVTVNSGIAGFQWKPYMNSFDSEYAIEGLKALGSVDPKAKVIYLTRNPLDRKISNMRHELGKQIQKDLPAHCKVNDVECKKRHSAAAGVGVTLPTGEALSHWLNVATRNDAKVGAILREAGVDYVKVSYEQLYNADNADEWMKIFRFLRVGPMEDLTVDDVRATFNLASTHSKGRNETVTNFIGVENTLKGTEFEHFLYD